MPALITIGPGETIVVTDPTLIPYRIGGRGNSNAKRKGWQDRLEGRPCVSPFPPARTDLLIAYDEGWLALDKAVKRGTLTLPSTVDPVLEAMSVAHHETVRLFVARESGKVNGKGEYIVSITALEMAAISDLVREG